MSGVAIVGAGELGAAIAHAIAGRGRIREITFVDDAAGVAAGKALDIQQAEANRSRRCTHRRLQPISLSAAGASVIVLRRRRRLGRVDGRPRRGAGRSSDARRNGGGARLLRPQSDDAGDGCAMELGLAGDRIVGTAASAIVGTVRALRWARSRRRRHRGVGHCRRPATRPRRRLVVGNDLQGSLATDRVAAHRLLAVGQSLGCSGRRRRGRSLHPRRVSSRRS